jgi:hypothetical protein
VRKTGSGLISVVFGLWFALFSGAPELLSPCPTHDLMAAAAAAQPAGHSHASGHAAHETAPANAPSNQDAGHQCHCPGPCCSLGTVVVPQVASVPLATIALRHEALAVVALDHVPTTPEHARPFANGPPRTLLRAPQPSLA